MSLPALILFRDISIMLATVSFSIIVILLVVKKIVEFKERRKKK